MLVADFHSESRAIARGLRALLTGAAQLSEKLVTTHALFSLELVQPPGDLDWFS